MANVVAGSVVANAAIAWKLQQSNGIFAPTVQGSDSLSVKAIPSATFNVMCLESYTLAPSATQTINFNSFLDLLQGTQTCTNALGFLLTGTGNGGQMKLSPSGTNPLTWFWGGTSPFITLYCGATGCGIFIMDGQAATISGAHGSIDVNNPSGTSIVVTIAAILGN